MTKSLLKKTVCIFIIFIIFTTNCAQAESAAAVTAEDYDEYAFALADITEMSITELQQAVDDGKLTYKQIMRLYLDRIEAYSDIFCCLISVSDTALVEAERCDEIYKDKGRSSMIFGLPVIVKDNIDVKGMVTTNGSSLYLGREASEDAEIIANIKKAGGIILAKANMDKMANHSQYSKSDFGTVNNSFDLNRTSYGSSGGSAVAAAVSLAPVCIGTDTNASIRVPASANGIAGFRPTRETVSTEGITPCMPERDVAGPMAKSAEDAAIIYGIMSGDNKDYKKVLESCSLKGTKIGVITSLSYCSGEVGELLENAVSTLQKAGAEIISLPIAPASDWKAEVEPYRRYFTAMMEKYGADAAIYPTIRSTVMSHETASHSAGNSNGWLIAPSAAAPAISVPMGLDKAGMPVGLEFAGKPFDDEKVLCIAHAFEQAMNLHIGTDLAPPLYEPPQSIAGLMEFAEEPVMKPFDRFTDGYEEVLDAYEEAVSLLETDYYLSKASVSEAERLMENYEAAAKRYTEAYQAWKTSVIAGAAAAGTVTAGLICAAVIYMKRRKKKQVCDD